jgi:hypothetical protein
MRTNGEIWAIRTGCGHHPGATRSLLSLVAGRGIGRHGPILSLARKPREVKRGAAGPVGERIMPRVCGEAPPHGGLPCLQGSPQSLARVRPMDHPPSQTSSPPLWCSSDNHSRCVWFLQPWRTRSKALAHRCRYSLIMESVGADRFAIGR